MIPETGEGSDVERIRVAEVHGSDSKGARATLAHVRLVVAATVLLDKLAHKGPVVLSDLTLSTHEKLVLLVVPASNRLNLGELDMGELVILCGGLEDFTFQSSDQRAVTLVAGCRRRWQ